MQFTFIDNKAFTLTLLMVRLSIPGLLSLTQLCEFASVYNMITRLNILVNMHAHLIPSRQEAERLLRTTFPSARMFPRSDLF